MTQEQYDLFKATVEEKGYKLHNVPRTIHNEDFYYYKGFAYSEKDEEKEAGYQVLFLVWDFTNYRDCQPEDYCWGVTPLILTDSHEWPRIDLEITAQNFDVDKVEEYAHDFYFNFVLTHGL